MTLQQNVKDVDPNPLATGPTKWRAERCVTHHHACDCREWEYACEVERLESRLAAANALLEIIRTGHDGKKYDYVEARDGHMVLVAPHLQGAGDEA